MGTSSDMLWALGIPLAVAARLLLHALGAQAVLGRRVEVATPLNSLLRLAEGQWLKQLGMSPYAGSAYHGSPLLLVILGPVLHIKYILTAFMLQAISRRRTLAHLDHMAALGISSAVSTSEKKQLNGQNGIRDVAGLLYLINPLTIVTCVGGTTSPIETLMTVFALYGAVIGNIPLAAFGWALSTHLSMYPGLLLIPVASMLVSGLDRPQRKLFGIAKNYNEEQRQEGYSRSPHSQWFSVPNWVALRDLAMWSMIWWLCILGLCSLAVGPNASLTEMLTRTYGFTLSVDDLTPNLGLFWYFFTEIFDHFRWFFTLVFHSNIAFLMLPVTLRMPHRPLFVAFIFMAICSLLRSYPSIGDAALYSGLLPLFAEELAGMRFTFLLFFGNLLVMTLGPVMYNLWIWRGTGNANFYFAINLVYAALQTILVVESLGTVIRYDRQLKKAVEHRVSVPRQKSD